MRRKLHSSFQIADRGHTGAAKLCGSGYCVREQAETSERASSEAQPWATSHREEIREESTIRECPTFRELEFDSGPDTHPTSGIIFSDPEPFYGPRRSPPKFPSINESRREGDCGDRRKGNADATRHRGPVSSCGRRSRSCSRGFYGRALHGPCSGCNRDRNPPRRPDFAD